MVIQEIRLSEVRIFPRLAEVAQWVEQWIKKSPSVNP